MSIYFKLIELTTIYEPKKKKKKKNVISIGHYILAVPFLFLFLFFFSVSVVLQQEGVLLLHTSLSLLSIISFIVFIISSSRIVLIN
jgi:hypothetical protein